MSMSTRIVGFRPPNEKWKKMKAAWDACEAAGVMPPKDVRDFFEGDEPDAAGVVVDIRQAVTPVDKNMTDGFDVDITKLPKDVNIIRFENSY
jgi:hypothetical protein